MINDIMDRATSFLPWRRSKYSCTDTIATSKYYDKIKANFCEKFFKCREYHIIHEKILFKLMKYFVMKWLCIGCVLAETDRLGV